MVVHALAEAGRQFQTPLLRSPAVNPFNSPQLVLPTEVATKRLPLYDALSTR
jgi:hypothetical protein